ncbi:MAG: alpha/beta hydrolase [Verrucomicrobiia bacterium]
MLLNTSCVTHQTVKTIASKKHYIEVNGIKMYYEIHGHGEPILLIHGGSTSGESYYKQVPALSHFFQVILPDSRAHGRTTDSDKPLSYELMAMDFVKLLKKLKIKKASIVGWSDGGVIGLYLAIHHPELVNKLVTFGANFDVNGITEEFKKAIETSHPKDHPAFLRERYEQISPEGPAYWPIFYYKLKKMWLNSPHFTIDQLKSIQAPTLILVGDHDIVKLEHTMALFRSIPNSQLCIVPGSTHLVPLEKPQLVNEMVLNFLQNSTNQAVHLPKN